MNNGLLEMIRDLLRWTELGTKPRNFKSHGQMTGTTTDLAPKQSSDQLFDLLCYYPFFSPCPYSNIIVKK